MRTDLARLACTALLALTAVGCDLDGEGLITLIPTEPVGGEIDPDLDVEGLITIRTWINIVAEESSATLTLPPGAPIAAKAIEGGMLARIDLNLLQLPLITGTITLEQIHLGIEGASLAGDVCIWPDASSQSVGSLVMDPVTGAATATLGLDARVQTTAQEFLGLPPIELEDTIELEIGGEGANGLLALVGALEAGGADGLFATEATIQAEQQLLGINAVFDMNMVVTNEGEPPRFESSVIESYCRRFYNLKGRARYYGVNPKGPYLATSVVDLGVKDPRVIELADLRAKPGDVLRLSTVGTYASLLPLGNGSRNEIGAVFSASDDLDDRLDWHRVPDAIDAGSNYVTSLPFPLCLVTVCSDIAEDFRGDDSVDVVVPPGATHLFVGPRDDLYGNNSGFGFGVTVERNPRN